MVVVERRGAVLSSVQMRTGLCAGGNCAEVCPRVAGVAEGCGEAGRISNEETKGSCGWRACARSVDGVGGMWSLA